MSGTAPPILIVDDHRVGVALLRAIALVPVFSRLPLVRGDGLRTRAAGSGGSAPEKG